MANIDNPSDTAKASKVLMIEFGDNEYPETRSNYGPFRVYREFTYVDVLKDCEAEHKAQWLAENPLFIPRFPIGQVVPDDRKIPQADTSDLVNYLIKHGFIEALPDVLSWDRTMTRPF